jgi:uncharacterized integral membrane protein
MKAKAIILIVLAVLFVVIIVQNSEPIAARILFWEFHTSQIILFFLTLLIGFIGGYIVGVIAPIEQKKKK